MSVELPNYAFISATDRLHTSVDDVLDFDVDNDLGKDARVAMLIKWTNQLYHDENLRTMFSDEWDAVSGVSRANKWRHRNQYYAGKIAITSLGADYIDASNSEVVEDASQPTGIDRDIHGLTAFACANQIIISPSLSIADTERTVITRDDFARLHSVVFNGRGDRLLTASSSLDLLYETDLNGNITWTMDLWDTPLNTNVLGQHFYRNGKRAPGNYVLNPTSEALKDDTSLRNANCVINDPAAYNYLGLTTNLTPVFPNGVDYGYDNTLLATTFHAGQAWVINRDSLGITVIKEGMRNPHGFAKDDYFENGYIASDTGNEAVVFVSNDLGMEHALDFASLDGRKPGLEKVKWLQNASHLSDDTYCAIMASRQKIVLFNPINRTRRDIDFDPDWGVQQVMLLSDRTV